MRTKRLRARVQTKLLEWVNDSKTKEIFFAYLSFSNNTVEKALCSAAKNRGVKIRFILDRQTNLGLAKRLEACSPSQISYEVRGDEGGIGYGHNKLFVINPSATKDIMKLAFSSGNLSAGVVLHHENWNFISAPVSTNFMQAHVCLMNGLQDHGRTKREFSAYIASCRKAIRTPVEDDIQAFFVPAEGAAAQKAILGEVNRSKQIDIAAHRFSFRQLIDTLQKRLGQKGVTARFVADDDLYWVGTTGVAVGANIRPEYSNVTRLVNVGAKVKWMETNHGAKLLHHNKYLIFDNRSVFAGAGNLTIAGFTKNYENYYLIKIPAVVSAFKRQYDHVWNDLATAPGDMPKKNVLPR